ncbi:hypothetical protein [uncultured Tateyamaria sp.]|uniref:hypothetical protein n=1 Tax=uncultured Tateyamaria sp. TaxID=455651 RepID=UPI0026148422|nr:hypothetical protein [uncultured Tateyamaria sp.]
MSNTQTPTSDPAKNGFDSTLSRAQETASDLADKAREQTELMHETVKTAANEGARQVQDTAHMLQEQASAASVQAADAVRRNPGLAIAGAVGVGVLLGLAMSRRS